VQQFPNSIWAGMAGFHAKENEYFKGNPANTNAPTVDFGK
jgi:LemA protein